MQLFCNHITNWSGPRQGEGIKSCAPTATKSCSDRQPGSATGQARALPHPTARAPVVPMLEGLGTCPHRMGGKVENDSGLERYPGPGSHPHHFPDNPRARASTRSHLPGPSGHVGGCVPLAPWYSKAWTSSSSSGGLAWELVRNADTQAPSETLGIRSCISARCPAVSMHTAG